MANNWETISFDCPPELHEEIEGFVDESLMFDTRSQFIRAAIRTMMDEERNEFSGAQ